MHNCCCRAANVKSSLHSKLAVTLLVIPPSLRYLERLWGSIETIKFLVATIVVSDIIAFAFNWIEFIGTKNADIFL